MSLVFRFANAEDALSCAEIYRPYVEKTSITFEYIPPDAGEIARRMKAYMPVFPWIVAEADGQIIGYAYASPQNVRKAYQWNADLTIYLREDTRGKGIGRLLYGCLLDVLVMQGYLKVIGIVTHPNPKSEALHQAMGFSVLAKWENAGYKLGRWYDVQWFAKQIAPVSNHPTSPVPINRLDQDEVKKIFEQYAARVK
ncbi:MAG: N-acetyltransferase family protein [Oscillospiraceae bacterium]|nr:N-acetyltransferase family protein [Oscillospiraceae bacterium]MDD5921111.1 GNAT family N-acetyltransferase [Oscillospiraceae bacterium]